jgi:hypothetical protein
MLPYQVDIMYRLQRAVTILVLMAALVLIVSPAQSSFTFLSGWPVFEDLPATVSKKPADNPPLLRSMVIDESYNGKSFGASRNETIVVQLKEPDPEQTWQYTGQGSFTIINDTILKSFPVLHDFRVKVRGPGDLMFAKVDSRSGEAVERFGVHVVIEEPEPKRNILPSYPLYDFYAVTPELLLLWQ